MDPVSFSNGLEHFEPQLSPAIAVAAAVAALPPILFWFRVFLNASKRLKDQAQAEEDRQVHWHPYLPAVVPTSSVRVMGNMNASVFHLDHAQDPELPNRFRWL